MRSGGGVVGHGPYPSPAGKHPMSRPPLLAVALVLGALLPLVAGDAPKLAPVFGERTFERPLGLYQPVGGKHIYVLQQRGTVLVFAPDGSAEGTVFLQRP